MEKNFTPKLKAFDDVVVHDEPYPPTPGFRGSPSKAVKLTKLRADRKVKNKLVKKARRLARK